MYYISIYNYAVGNPFLLPAFTNSFAFTYSHNNFNAKLYYNSTANSIGNYAVVDSADVNMMVQEANNFLDIRTAGISIYKLFNKLAWLESVAQADFSYSKFVSHSAALANSAGYGGNISLNNTVYFDKAKNMQGVLNLQDQIPGIYYYRNKKNGFELDMGFNYILPKKNFEFNLLVNDIFKTATPQYWYVTNGVKQVYHNYYDSRSVQLSVKYNFGNRFIKNSDRTLNNEAERNRL